MTCSIFPTDIAGIFTTYYTLVIFLMVVVVGFLYMFSRIFKEWAGLAQTELRELYISIFIGIFSILLAAVVCQGLSGYIQSKYGISGDHFSIAENYVGILIYGGEGKLGAIDITTKLFASSFEVSVLAKGFQLSGETTGTFKVFAPLEFFATGIRFFLDLIYMFTVVSLQIQRISLFAAEAFAFSLILPIGLILRVIPITRSAGSFLIALAFGLYVIWPILYVFEYDVTMQVVKLKGDEISEEVRTYYESNPAVLATRNPNNPNYVFEVLKKSMGAERVSFIFKDMYTLCKDLAMVIVPQSTILGVINFTILIAFVNQLDDFLKSL
jgi:hypothetical protein